MLKCKGASSFFDINVAFKYDNKIIQLVRRPYDGKKDKTNHIKGRAKYRVVVNYSIKTGEYNTKDRTC